MDIKYLVNLSGPKRWPQSPDDWGDSATVDISLKRKGKSFDELLENDFGYFGGEVEGKWVVAIKSWECRIKDIELFDSLEQLQREWICD